MNDPFLLLLQPSEILAMTTGRINGDPVVVVTARIGEGRLEPANLSLAPEQARRLLEDLQSLFKRSKVLSQVAGDDEARRAFERIVGGEGG